MNEDLFKGLEPAAPPPGLREAALRAGRQALRVETPADVWSRLFRSVPARLSWAASVLLLLGAHAFLPATPQQARAETPSAEPEITALARLPRIEDRALAAQPGERS